MDAENVFAICDGDMRLEDAKKFGADFIPEENFVCVPRGKDDDEESPDLHALVSGILLKKFKEEDDEEDDIGLEYKREGCGACCSLM